MGLANHALVACVALGCTLSAAAEDFLLIPGMAGRHGGNLVYAQRTEPRTLNPATAGDSGSREIIYRMSADLIHINRQSQHTEPALAKSWTVSPDGLHYVLELRQGLRFSDGHPFDADDVVFSFQVYLDEKIQSPQRDLLLLQGEPISVHKLSPYQVRFDFPHPYAAAERLFDSFSILPKHLLEEAYRAGKLSEAWGLRTTAATIAGLGPFRLKQYVPGQRLILERNPYYWKTDSAGRRLPYLDTAEFVFAGSEDMQVLRLESGESDILNRVGARNYAALDNRHKHRDLQLRDAGPGFEYNFLFFNLTKPGGFQARTAFRRAVSQAIDREAIVRLVYLGHAAPLNSPVPVGNAAWQDASITPVTHSPRAAREMLKSQGFSWTQDGTLIDPDGKRVEFSILTSAGNSDRTQMAAMIQDDLRQLGMNVHVMPLEFRSLLDRVLRTHEYEACLLSLASPDADPNPDMGVWLSSGGNHLWNPLQKTPATPWEGEIDRLMRQQMVTPVYAERKRLFDRVQELLAENMPMIPLVTPDVLVGAKSALGNFRPALLDHYTLWNIEELYWRQANAGPGK